MDVVDDLLERFRRWLDSPNVATLEGLFSPVFLAQIPPPELKQRLDHLTRELGRCTAFHVVERLANRSARIEGHFSGGYAAPGIVALDDGQPPRIQWLHFDLPTRRGDSWADIERDVRALPGAVSFCVRDLSNERQLAAVEPDRALGAGSISKLVILSALLRQIAAGQRRWDEVFRFDDADRSLPTGILQDWPAGAPLTVHSLGVLLVAMSDNSAADLLLRVLGRETVEEALAPLPERERALNRPFLSTRGIFALVAGTDAERRAYQTASLDEKRRLLAAAEARPRPEIAQLAGVWPEGLDWYLSSAGVCALLGQLRRQLVELPVARGLFELHVGGLNLGRWRFSGVKGGASPGRNALATLLEDDAGRWVATCLVHNAPPDGANLELVARLVKRAADHVRAEQGG